MTNNSLVLCLSLSIFTLFAFSSFLFSSAMRWGYSCIIFYILCFDIIDWFMCIVLCRAVHVISETTHYIDCLTWVLKSVEVCQLYWVEYPRGILIGMFGFTFSQYHSRLILDLLSLTIRFALIFLWWLPMACLCLWCFVLLKFWEFRGLAWLWFFTRPPLYVVAIISMLIIILAN